MGRRMPPLPTKVSRACFKRDGWKCRHCKDRNGIHPHHIIEQCKGDKSTDELNNLLTLCAGCHRAFHDGFLRIHVLSVMVDDVLVRFERLRGWKPV